MFRVVTKSENTQKTKNNSTAVLSEEKAKSVEKVEPDKNKLDLRYKPDPYMETANIEPYTPITIETEKKHIENQIIIYDKNTNEWKVINESDSYLYNT